MAKVDKAFKREGNSFTKPKFTIMDRIAERLRLRNRKRQMKEKGIHDSRRMS